MHDVEAARMSLTVGDGTHTPQVVTTSHHHKVTCSTGQDVQRVSSNTDEWSVPTSHILFTKDNCIF